MQINKLAEHVGAEVIGLDIRKVDAATVQALRAELVTHGVLVFRDQQINDDDHVNFARHFGHVETPTKEANLGDEKPEILELRDIGDPTKFTYTAQYWHTDGSFKPVPSYLTLLRAVKIAEEGGETGFANACAGYAALPETRKRELKKLRVFHDIQQTRDKVAGLPPFPPHIRAAYPGAEHDLIRTIPETGRELLYVGSHAKEVIGMSREDGRALLDELTEWTTQPQFTYAHRWRPGDLVVWDNRGVLHRAMPYDATRHTRVMRRAEVAGQAA